MHTDAANQVQDLYLVLQVQLEWTHSRQLPCTLQHCCIHHHFISLAVVPVKRQLSQGMSTKCCTLATLALLPALQAIVSSELAGLEPVAHQLLAANVPYVASVQLNPPLGYDPDKVKLVMSSANWTRGPGGVWRSGTGQPLVGSCMRLAVPLLRLLLALACMSSAVLG